MNKKSAFCHDACLCVCVPFFSLSENRWYCIDSSNPQIINLSNIKGGNKGAFLFFFFAPLLLLEFSRVNVLHEREELFVSRLLHLSGGRKEWQKKSGGKKIKRNGAKATNRMPTESQRDEQTA